MRPAEIRSLLSTVFTVSAAVVFSSCQSTSRTARVLPAYEAPLARSDFQNVRMTAYTHTEADHTQYGARNALGGQLHAAGPAIRRAENVARAVPAEFDAQLDYQRVAYSGAPRQPFAMEETTATATSTTTTARTRTARSTKSVHGAKRAIAVAKKTPKIGSAAADWSRWPAGTTFRLLSTGQIYCVDDYGWALSGRNTIDLYMATPREMNSWGARQEPIQILKWGDPVQSMRLLAPRQGYKHIHRMVLELEGRDQAAAGLQ